uniref:histone deacetylase family protein n=1 Tax=Roseivirga sp. TaxID=1964215 RepID=UPI00404836CC
MLKIAWNDIYAHVLPDNHRFPMAKYNLLPEQLLYEGTITSDQLFSPKAIDEAQVLRTHDADYWHSLKTLQLSRKEERKTGFPLSERLVQREITIMGGTIEAAQYALIHGISMNIAGGTHHAFTNRGEGFCLLNDIAIAAHSLLDQKLVKQILVVDLDVHQGNGTAQIFQNEPRVFTFSMHGAANYPLHKEKSDLDIGLKDGTDDHEYLALLDFHLKALLEKVQPDFIFYQSGVDVLATDKLGRLGMTINGCKQRDSLVLEQCKRNAIPVAACMGGGYSEKISHIVEAHANTFRLAQALFF